MTQPIWVTSPGHMGSRGQSKIIRIVILSILIMIVISMMLLTQCSVLEIIRLMQQFKIPWLNMVMEFTIFVTLS